MAPSTHPRIHFQPACVVHPEQAAPHNLSHPASAVARWWKEWGSCSSWSDKSPPEGGFLVGGQCDANCADEHPVPEPRISGGTGGALAVMEQAMLRAEAPNNTSSGDASNHL